MEPDGTMRRSWGTTLLFCALLAGLLPAVSAGAAADAKKSPPVAPPLEVVVAPAARYAVAPWTFDGIAIDPVTTMRIEEVLKELRRDMTIILVTNLTQQARRLADRTLFLWDGEIVELDRTEVIFSEHPANPKTYDYVNGIFG